ncbi:amidase family protein [Pontimicrobium sp. MEBiC01747]
MKKQETEIAEETSDLKAISAKDITEFKVLDSKFISKRQIWNTLESQMRDFSETQYNTLKPLILEQDILTLQKHIKEGRLSYEMLVKFYLYRIKLFDRENDLSLNAVIALNPNVIQQAIDYDKALKKEEHRHPVYGMPILLKDNINAENMPTTAGAVALQGNTTKDAFIVKQLKAKGALILGKANLSEWAYFFCGECPSGYSAIGGQTLNPYGRRTIDTGGSSSGSGVAVAANFCVAAVGSETAGSILSPASQNSVVGLKPTIGLVSRSGIIPISETLDTAGPMTKNVTDNAIVLDALFGYDAKDFKGINTKWGNSYYYNNLNGIESLNSKRFGAFKSLMTDTLYTNAISTLKKQGATIIELEAEDVNLPDFLRLLNLDMKKDLPSYIANYGNPSVPVKTVQDVITFNSNDSINIMPYGQALFRGIVADKSTEEKFKNIKEILKTNGKRFFDAPMLEHKLNGVLSINNYHAAYAAVAEYPAITIPMGYTKTGEPKGLTIITKPLAEKQLLSWGLNYEQASKKRIPPTNYN